MKKFLKSVEIFISLCFIFIPHAIHPQNLPKDLNFWSDVPNDVLALEITDRMTDEELYSQILMFGWAGAEPENLLFQWVNRGLGSVKVFGWNTDDIHLVAKSISALQRLK